MRKRGWRRVPSVWALAGAVASAARSSGVQRVGGSDRRRAQALSWRIYDLWPAVVPVLSGQSEPEPPEEMVELFEAASSVLDAAGGQTVVGKSALALMREGKVG
jgi:hypothetical protein